MIKGAIETASSDGVSGWIFASQTKLKGALVLAFVGKECVGAGQVGIFRQDLADAGLDDGHLGFQFPIALPEGADSASVVVRLDGCDAVLLQGRSQVMGNPVTVRTAFPDTQDAAQRRLRWLRQRNALDQGEFDILRALVRFGAYEYVPVASALGQDSQEAQLVAASRDIFELSAQGAVEATVQQVTTRAELLEALRVSTETAGRLSLVALWSPRRTHLGVVEGSHYRGAHDLVDPAGGIDYNVDPSSVLFLDSRCVVTVPAERWGAGLTLISGRYS